METVSLDIGEGSVQIINTKEPQPQIQQQPPPNQNSQPSTSNEAASISQYFQSVPSNADPVASSFFDSIPVASDASLMMKSISDAAALAELSAEQTVIEDNIDSSLHLSDNICEQAVDISLVSNAPQVEPSSTLVELFKNEDGGGDMEGKAFFDTIANRDIFPPISPSNLEIPFITQEAPVQAIPVEHYPFYDYWCPSKETQAVLATIANSPIGTFFPNKSQLTMPGIMIKDELVDPVGKKMQELNIPQAKDRKALIADAVNQDASGILHLISEHCYHAAINLTGRLLMLNGQGLTSIGHPSKHTPSTLQLWLTRLCLLVKLQKWEIAEKEAESFGELDKPDMFYEFHPDLYPGQSGSMAPFALRCLLAQLPQYLGKPQLTLTRLSALKSTVTQILKKIESPDNPYGLTPELKAAALELWKQRECTALYSFLNCSLSIKDFSLCIKLLDLLLEKDLNHSLQLESAYGRVYLQLGDMVQAREHFAKATKLVNPEVISDQVEDLVNNALILISLDQYADAYTLYHQAHKLMPGNQALANNMGVCLLYTGKLKEALSFLESSTLSQVLKNFHQGMIFNICTLYELESSRCSEKKMNLLSFLSSYVGDNFDTACLKIPKPKEIEKS